LVVASVGSPRLSSSWHDAAPRLLLLNPNGGDSSSLARRRLLLGTNGVLLFSGSDPGFLGFSWYSSGDGGLPFFSGSGSASSTLSLCPSAAVGRG